MLRNALLEIIKEGGVGSEADSHDTSIRRFLYARLAAAIQSTLNTYPRKGIYFDPDFLEVIFASAIVGRVLPPPPSLCWVEIRDTRLLGHESDVLRTFYFFSDDMSRLVIALSLKNRPRNSDLIRSLQSTIRSNFAPPEHGRLGLSRREHSEYLVKHIDLKHRCCYSRTTIPRFFQQKKSLYRISSTSLFRRSGMRRMRVL
jgi:hypothetical protein